MPRAPQNVAASVHRRLLNRAKATGRPFNELLQHYAMERFLYRLAQSTHSRRFVLKGALLLRVWEAPAVRPTMDIDLLGHMSNGVDALTAAVREICGQLVEPDGHLAEAAGKRFHRGVLLYGGTELLPFRPGMFAIPIPAVWQLTD